MYADSSQASGLFFEDKFTTGGVEVESVLMGLSLESHFVSFELFECGPEANQGFRSVKEYSA